MAEPKSPPHLRQVFSVTDLKRLVNNTTGVTHCENCEYVTRLIMHYIRYFCDKLTKTLQYTDQTIIDWIDVRFVAPYSMHTSSSPTSNVSNVTIAHGDFVRAIGTCMRNKKLSWAENVQRALQYWIEVRVGQVLLAVCALSNNATTLDGHRVDEMLKAMIKLNWM